MPHFQRNITLEVANDPEGIRKLIEDERPIIEIGKDTAYHSVTHGFILDLVSLFVSDWIVMNDIAYFCEKSSK